MSYLPPEKAKAQGKRVHGIPEKGEEATSDACRIACQQGIPTLLVGSKTLVQWLASIRILIRPDQIRYIRMASHVTEKRWGDDPRYMAYEEDDLSRIVEAVCGVPAKTWLEARANDPEDLPGDVMRATWVSRRGLMIRNASEGLAKTRESFQVYTMVEMARQDDVPDRWLRRPFERVIRDPRHPHKLMMAVQQNKASSWDPTKHDIDNGGKSAWPRIMRYTALYRASEPRMRPVPKTGKETSRGVMVARSIFAVYHINSETGRMELCKVPSDVLGYAGEVKDLPAVIVAGSPLKHALAHAIRARYNQYFWFSWDRGVEVHPFTLKPKTGPFRTHDTVKVQMPHDAISAVGDDPKQFLEDLEAEDL